MLFKKMSRAPFFQKTLLPLLLYFINHFHQFRSFKPDQIQISNYIIGKRVCHQQAPLFDDIFGCDLLLANQKILSIHCG